MSGFPYNAAARVEGLQPRDSRCRWHERCGLLDVVLGRREKESSNIARGISGSGGRMASKRYLYVRAA